jgi:hypothetical protein
MPEKSSPERLDSKLVTSKSLVLNFRLEGDMYATFLTVSTGMLLRPTT